jgi:hypothetical protein
MSIIKTRFCKSIENDGCGVELPLSKFYAWHDKIDIRCKVCRSKLQKKRYKAKQTQKNKTVLNNFHKLPKESQTTALNMIRDGKTLYAVAKFLEKTPTTIYRWEKKGLLIAQP